MEADRDTSIVFTRPDLNNSVHTAGFFLFFLFFLEGGGERRDKVGMA